MDHRIDVRQALPLTPLFPGLNLTYALYLLHTPLLALRFLPICLGLDVPWLLAILGSVLESQHAY